MHRGKNAQKTAPWGSPHYTKEQRLALQSRLLLYSKCSGCSRDIGVGTFATVCVQCAVCSAVGARAVGVLATGNENVAATSPSYRCSASPVLGPAAKQGHGFANLESVLQAASEHCAYACANCSPLHAPPKKKTPVRGSGYSGYPPGTVPGLPKGGYESHAMP